MRRLLLAGLFVGCLGAFSPAHSATVANLWVSPGGGSCIRTPVRATFLTVNACGSFNAAYQAAAAGDLILVRGGTYGSQTIADRPSLGTTPVTIQVAVGETVTLQGGLSVRTHDLIVHGGDQLGVEEPNRIVSTGGISALRDSPGQGNRNVVFEDFKAPTVFVTAHGFTLRHSDIGDYNPCNDANDGDIVMIWPQPTPTDNVTIEYNRIGKSDQRGCPGTSKHSDLIVAWASSNLVIRGNRLWWCATQCIYVPDDGLGPPNNVLIENNMIEETNSALCPNCGWPGEITFKNGTNITVRYNTLSGGVNVDGSAAPVWKGNVFLSPQSACETGTWSYNVFPASGGTTCGTNAKRGTPLLANGSPYSPPASGTTAEANWRLNQSDTVARASGDPGNFPPFDIDRLARLAPPSAGASEVTASGGTPPSPPSGLGLSRAIEETPLQSKRAWIFALLLARPGREPRRSGWGLRSRMVTG